MASLPQPAKNQQPDLSIQKFFAKVKDPRRVHRRRHQLQDILVIAPHLSLGQGAVDTKSNGLAAIPVLLEMLDLHGALVNIDAMGCQKEIAAKIVAGGGDDALTVKDNQPHLLEDIQACFEQALD